MEFNYYTGIQCKTLYDKVKNKCQLSIFHVNIRSLNANYKKLIELVHSNNLNFEIIVLSEIWNCNLHNFTNLFPGYDFFLHCAFKSESRWSWNIC